MKKSLDDAGIVKALRGAAGQDFDNASEFTMRDLNIASALGSRSMRSHR